MQSVEINRRVVKPRRLMELVGGKLRVRDVGEDRKLESGVKNSEEDLEENKRKEKGRKRRKKAEELKIQGV